MTRVRVTRIGHPKPPVKEKSPRKRMKKSRIKPKPRSASEYARIYGSKERVEWVKSLPCLGCRRRGLTENHHSVTGGMGKKAAFTTIVPLCCECHYWLHRWGKRTWEVFAGIDLKQAAAEIEARWQSHIESLQEKTA